MKNIITSLLILISLNSFGQLNTSAQSIKIEMPDSYTAIKKWSEFKYGDNYKMVLYEINKQSDAFIQLIKIWDKGLDQDEKTMFVKALRKWRDISTDDPWANYTVNWKMVLYEYSKQNEAKNAY